MQCPSCGKPAGGKFCRHCGATLGAAETAPPGDATLARYQRLLWFVSGGATVAVLGGLVLALAKGNAAPPVAAAAPADAPFAAGADGATPPDISNMSPRERFDRLFNRVMRAAESGDEATVTAFAPMAIQAYTMLDSVDADARYHLALIYLHTGDVDGARAQGDSILQAQPGHLFGYVVKGTIARFQQDKTALPKIYSDFLAHYDAEQARKRPEYAEHPRALEDFLKSAKGER